jgi:hypothetical protein
MIVSKGEKLHIMYRSFYEKSSRRHVIGEIVEVQGCVCRLEGFVFVYDDKKTEFVKKPEKRTTIIDVAESGIIVNVIDSSVILEKVRYRYVSEYGLIATDDADFSLDINEFGSKS